MRVSNALIVLILSSMLISCVAAFGMPNLFSMPIVSSLKPNTTLQSPQVDMGMAGTSAGDTFTLSLSGNVYMDKIPINGAEVTVYLNGRNMGKTTAGDIYMFNVPGVREGDTIRVDASYEGYTGSATKQVSFKNMYLDVTISSKRSFIRTALEMLPTSDDMKNDQASTSQAQTPATSTGSTGDSGATTSSADAGKLTSQIWGDTSNVLGNTLGQFKSAM